MDNKEIRKITIEAPEVRSDRPEEASRHIVGYACVFNSLSEDLGGFREQIIPDAMVDVIERSDVFALLDHSYDAKLARSRYGKGSLKLTIDEKGLKYEFDAPATDAGDQVVEAIRRGDITSSSFAFTVSSDEWQKLDDGNYLRTIKKFDKLYDVSPVWEPAYSGTSVTCQRFNEIQEQEQAENEKKMAEAEKQRKAELSEYFQEIRAKIEAI